MWHLCCMCLYVYLRTQGWVLSCPALTSRAASPSFWFGSPLRVTGTRGERHDVSPFPDARLQSGGNLFRNPFRRQEASSAQQHAHGNAVDAYLHVRAFDIQAFAARKVASANDPPEFMHGPS